MNPQQGPLTVYTIGHSNIPDYKFIELLLTHGIELVVDVRSAPYSQFAPQYNRETLQKTLALHNIAYEFAGDRLGGRPSDPACYKQKRLPEEGETDYLHLVDYPLVMTRDFFRAGIERLLQVAQEKRTTIMCSEEDPARCHRHHLIGRYLVRHGVNVLHIRGDGNLVKDELFPYLEETPPPEQLSLF